ncbi:hypothetical protein FVE67_04490 [Thermosulfurimonas marina]|uniref:Rod shape-determining protein MreD n=1 Tax=Thermosulfurimonas marina TaxID=2047767 RepID=A0A6H1WSE8_9BACT|nr:hypothetical protein [Thermosulfurimonas marina]QJA06098.1 hypothetical protein FVE67_04490 [Thermosulfurimonas marina]
MKRLGILGLIWALEIFLREFLRVYPGEIFLAAGLYFFLVAEERSQEALTGLILLAGYGWLRDRLLSVFLTLIFLLHLKSLSRRHFHFRSPYPFLLFSGLSIFLWGLLGEGLFPYLFEKGLPARWGLHYLKFSFFLALWYFLIFLLYEGRKEEFLLPRRK